MRHQRRVRALSFFAIVLFGLLATAHAQEPSPSPPFVPPFVPPVPGASPSPSPSPMAAAPRGPSRSLFWENDQRNWSFRGSGNDRFYTNGIRYSQSYADRSEPEWLKLAVEKMQLRQSIDSTTEAPEMEAGWVIGQNMYTATDIAVVDPPLDDRPYGAWLHVGVFARAVTLNASQDSFRRMQTVELDLGMVGPAALGRQTQTFIHKLIDVTKPLGWGTQLRNEPGLHLLYDSRWKNFEAFGAGRRRWFDTVTHLGFSAGNIFTLTRTGATVRFGKNMSDDFGPAATIPAVSLADRLKRPGFEFYVFGRAEGRGVLHNIFLDGNTFSDSRRVDKKGFVADLEFGVSARLKRFRVTWRRVSRSREFETQPERAVFGSWNFALERGL